MITVYKAKNTESHTKDEYRKFFQLVHWATREQVARYFGIDNDVTNWRKLDSLIEKGELDYKFWIYGENLDKKVKIYSSKRRNKGANFTNDGIVKHGLRATEIAIRLYLSDIRGELLADKDFHAHSNWPDAAIRYPSGSQLLIEYSSTNNTKSYLLNKTVSYSKWLGEKDRVLFVCDTGMDNLKRFQENHHPAGWFYFTTWDLFIKAPHGKQLSASIYLWDGQPTLYPLGDDYV